MITHTMRHVVAPALANLLRVLAVLFCALTMLSWTPRVLAHASLVASTPTAGAVLSSAPTQAHLAFNEPISPLVLKIIQPDGTAIGLHQVQTLPDGLQLSLPPLAQEGAYALSWRVISADGHPVGGTLAFSVGVKEAGSVQAVAEHPSRTFLIWLSRLSWYVGLFFGIGLAGCHSLNVARHDTRCLGGWMLVLGMVATLLNVGLLGVDALDRPLSGLLTSDVWRAASATSFGLSATLALAALGCAAMVWRTASPSSKRTAAGLALILLGAALAASGHASVAPQAWLARPAVWLHAVAIVLWVGSLVPLAYALGDSPDLILLKRFSRAIPVVLLVLFASGGGLIYLQFDTLSSLWLTAYGQILALKLALLMVLLGLGAYNRYYLTNAVLSADIGPRRAMRRIVYLECALAIAILATVALWRFTPPPRALHTASISASAFPHVISARVHVNTIMADLALVPAAHGQPAALTLYLFNPDMTPLTAQEVDVAFSNASAGIEPIVFPAQRTSDGAWQVEKIELPRQDSWHVRIDALVSDFERLSLETTLELLK